MVARSGRYFGGPFKGQCGVIHGNPISPAIFNLMVDAVFRHWVSVVVEAEGCDGLEGFVRYVQRLVAYFYADYGLITSTWSEILQRVFDVLKDIFDRFNLRTNIGKTVSMIFQPYHAIAGHSAGACGLWVTWEGLIYR